MQAVAPQDRINVGDSILFTADIARMSKAPTKHAKSTILRTLIIGSDYGEGMIGVGRSPDPAATLVTSRCQALLSPDPDFRLANIREPAKIVNPSMAPKRSDSARDVLSRLKSTTRATTKRNSPTDIPRMKASLLAFIAKAQACHPTNTPAKTRRTRASRKAHWPLRTDAYDSTSNHGRPKGLITCPFAV